LKKGLKSQNFYGNIYVRKVNFHVLLHD